MASDKKYLQGLSLIQLKNKARGLRYNLGRSNISAEKRNSRVIKVGLDNINGLNKEELIEKFLELTEMVP